MRTKEENRKLADAIAHIFETEALGAFLVARPEEYIEADCKLNVTIRIPEKVQARLSSILKKMSMILPVADLDEVVDTLVTGLVVKGLALEAQRYVDKVVQTRHSITDALKTLSQKGDSTNARD